MRTIQSSHILENRSRLTCCQFERRELLDLKICKMLHFIALNLIPKSDAQNLTIFADQFHFVLISLYHIKHHPQKDKLRLSDFTTDGK